MLKREEIPTVSKKKTNSPVPKAVLTAAEIEITIIVRAMMIAKTVIFMIYLSMS